VPGAGALWKVSYGTACSRVKNDALLTNVYAPVPVEDEQNIAIHEALADVAIDILLHTGVSIA
jgi:hypothetical protein